MSLRVNSENFDIGLLLETNSELRLRHLTKFIQVKAPTCNLNDVHINYFVRGKNNKASYDKINSSNVSLKELQQCYWSESSKIQSIYFMI